MGPKLALFICILFSVLASGSAAKCRLRAGDFFISANTSLPNLSSQGSYLAFSGGPAMGAPDDGVREPHYFLSSIDSNNKMNFKYVVRACERQTDQFDILWDKDCLGFSLTLSSTGGDHCAPGFAGSYRAIDYCQRACKLRAGLLLQREDGVTTIVGVRSKVVKGDSVFPVITSDPSKGSSWAEWTETLTAELLQLQTIAEVNTHGLVITEKDNRLCTSRGAYDLEFRDYCTTARIQPTKSYDICPIRAATFGPDYRYNVSWCGPDGHVEYVPPNNDSSSGIALLPGVFALVIAALAVFLF